MCVCVIKLLVTTFEWQGNHVSGVAPHSRKTENMFLFEEGRGTNSNLLAARTWPTPSH